MIDPKWGKGSCNINANSASSRSERCDEALWRYNSLRRHWRNDEH